ncbi:MAG: PA14 domain-containing protein [Planctomycetaceae bacterium]
MFKLFSSQVALSAGLIAFSVGWTEIGHAETGVESYQRQCARCHGAAGAGTENAPEPLIGDKSVAELAKVIAATMPQDAPGTCTGEDAARVAAFIHEDFYSPVAQARRRPARVEYSRLTVRQYRNAVADLIASFRPRPPQLGDEPGLLGRYLQVRDGPMDDHSFTRTDPGIDFDFGEASPNPEKIGAEEFGMWWHGAVFAPDTGEYEFIVETQNGIRLWLNDYGAPLIDGSVRSGENVTWRATAPLLGGRYYFLKMEFFKSKAAKEKVAAVRLKWKPPHGAEQVIPGRFLRAQEVPEVQVVHAVSSR